MKKLLTLSCAALALVCALALCGCGSSSSSSSNSSSNNSASVSSEDPTSQISIDEEYSYQRDGYTYHFLVVTNNSSVTASISSNSTALDKNKEEIGSAEDTVNAVGPGCTTILVEQFTDCKGAKSFDTDLEAEEDEYYSSVLQDLDMKVTAKKKKAIVKVTNNSDNDAEYVEAYALFFKGDKLVNHGFAYTTNDDAVLKAGKSKSVDISPYDTKFDTVKVYLTAIGPEQDDSDEE